MGGERGEGGGGTRGGEGTSGMKRRKLRVVGERGRGAVLRCQHLGGSSRGGSCLLEKALQYVYFIFAQLPTTTGAKPAA